MSDIWEKFKDTAEQVVSEVDKGGQIQSTISSLRQRMADADRNRKVNQIKQQIRDLQNQEAQAINALSAQVLALHEAGTLTQPELVSLCRNVDEIRAQIRGQQAELDKIQPAAPAPSSSGRCPNCGVAVVPAAAFCQSCGTQLLSPAVAPVRYCVACGAQLREKSRFCPQCGETVPTVQPRV
jgi:predicted RNA-binding Zn-ribbon protein involved in translation (DUF1610 family)